jgi:hypothetical protein
MKFPRYLCFLLLFLTGLSVSAIAQYPSINNNGVVMNSTKSTTLFWSNYWSIYGSNLSSGSGATVTINGWVDNSSGGCKNSALTFSKTQNNPGGWQESSSQIIFYALHPPGSASTTCRSAYYGNFQSWTWVVRAPGLYSNNYTLTPYTPGG